MCWEATPWVGWNHSQRKGGAMVANIVSTIVSRSRLPTE